MIRFDVPDMTCGHCVATITRAVQGVDAGARVQADLPQHRVEIDGTAADAQRLRAAIEEAGFTPVPVPA